jgi:threonine dehydrogenase-like Zn-dependent dehydrogenase
MKGLVVDAEWNPKPGYRVSELEVNKRIAFRGNMVWKNPTWVIKDVPIPELDSDEVLIEVYACGVCGSDVHMLRKGEDNYVFYGGWCGFPTIIGHEFSGRIVKVGNKVKSLKVGDLVTAEEVQWCGECKPCRTGWFNQCKMMSQLGFEPQNPGAMAQYVKVKEKYVWKLDGLYEAYKTDEEVLEAGSLVEPTAVAYEGIFTVARGFPPGGHVAVFGTGPIGLACIQLVRAAGAAKIIAVEPLKVRRDLAEKMGANYTIDPSEQHDLPSKILDLTGGEGCDMLIEAAGVPEKTIPWMVKCLGVSGKIVVIGMGPEKPPLDLLTIQYSEASIYGSLGHSGHGDFGYVINLMASRRINMLPAITSRYPLEDAIKAITTADKGNDAKVTIFPNK